MSENSQYLGYVVNHVFMPTKLPQKGEQSDGYYDKEEALCEVALESARTFFTQLPGGSQNETTTVLRMLEAFSDLNAASSFEAEDLVERLAGATSGDVIPLFIRKQNAGVIFRIREEDVIVETFEVSPKNETVLACPGRLLCTYPGPSVSFPATFLEDQTFLFELCSFLAQMNVDVLEGSAAHAGKAGSHVLEVRDTADPKYISNLLVGILTGFGEGDAAVQVPRITKRVADDVLWKDALLPWRRSPVWLVLRVALQTTLDAADAFKRYKSFLLFFMSDILERVMEIDISSHLVSHMRQKIGRRAGKLGDRLSTEIAEKIHNVLEKSEHLLQMRWNGIQNEERLALQGYWDPAVVHPERDTTLTLSNSMPYIRTVLSRKTPNRSTDALTSLLSSLKRPFRAASDFTSLMTIGFHSGDAITQETNLADFEFAIEQHADQWPTQGHISSSSKSCSLLSQKMKAYWKAASQSYGANAQARSCMFLCLLTMWVILDKFSVAQLPLLSKYPPEVPTVVLENLLLRREGELKRARKIMGYLYGRQTQAVYPSVFSVPAGDSFSVQYFDASHPLQQLKRDVEALATQQRTQKVAELRTLTANREKWLSAALGKQHAEYCGEKKVNCEKCNLTAKAKISIRVHEWPLPSDSALAKTIIFELRCPEMFSEWREATYWLLHDILTGAEHWTKMEGLATEKKKKKVSTPAIQHGVLAQFASQGFLGKALKRADHPRITYASATKSFSKTHYRKVKLPCNQQSVVLGNGCSWRLYDTTNSLWMDAPIREVGSALRCQIELHPSLLYQDLNFAMGKTHTMNDVLAQQSAMCSRDLNPLEYIAFCSLRAGGRTQWLNILRELASDALTFSSLQVHQLIYQAAYEIGPLSSSGVLEWHDELLSDPFCHQILALLETLYNNVADNWMELQTLHTAACLVTRILSVNVNIVVTQRATELLRSVRGRLHGWLLAAIQSTGVESANLTSIDLRICELAAICQTTYDVDPRHRRALLHTDEDVTIFLQCQIAISESSHEQIAGGQALKDLLWQHRRLSNELLPEVTRLALQSSVSVDNAVVAVWPHYRPNGRWIPVSSSVNWICSFTAAAEDSLSQVIHLNILTGQFLVDGKALGRLPAQILDHAVFKYAFGLQTFLVIPSDRADTQYMARSLIAGHKLFFGLQHDQLVIRATRPDNSNTQLELIPTSIFVGDLPTILVNNHIFWLDVRRQRIEARSKSTMWNFSPANWALQLTPGTPRRMKQYSRMLVDLRSPTHRMICAQFRNFEESQFIVVSYRDDERVHRTTYVDLPRLKLAFRLTRDGQRLESVNMPRHVVDPDQSIGTLVGLSNRLVLTEYVKDHLLPRSRRILVPIGDIHCQITEDHVNVRITHDAGSSDRIAFYDFVLSPDLGRLTGNGSIEAHFYRVLLHAVTTYVLPDPLTGQTGLEAALEQITSAASMSFQTLSPAALRILQRIHDLVPRRAYYPTGLKKMCRVQWSKGMSIVSQDVGFESPTRRILTYAGKLSMFNGEDASEAKSEIEDALEFFEGYMPHELLARARGSLATTTPSDRVYVSRAQQKNSCDFHRRIAQTVVKRNLSLLRMSQNPGRLALALSKWGRIAGTQHGGISLTYHQSWLSPTLMCGDNWATLYNLCHQVPLTRRPGLVFCISSMAFEMTPEDFEVACYLVASAILPAFQSIKIPTIAREYNLQHGSKPGVESVRAVFVEHVHDMGLARTKELAQISVNSMLSLWPRVLPIPEILSKFDAYVTKKQKVGLQNSLHSLVSSWRHNSELLVLASRMDNALNEARLFYSQMPRGLSESLSVIPSPPSKPVCRSSLSNTSLKMTLIEVLMKRPAVFDIDTQSGLSTDTGPWIQQHSTHSHLHPGTLHALDSLVSEFQSSTTALNAAYGHSLQVSIAELKGHHRPDQVDANTLAQRSQKTVALSDTDGLQEHLRLLVKSESQMLDNIIASLRDATAPRTTSERFMASAGLWPTVTLRHVLSMLSRAGKWHEMSAEWQRVLSMIAYAVLRRQRAQRMLFLCSHRKDEELEVEMQNICSEDIALALAHPDWLLIQIENNFLARPIQIQVALEMFSPSSGQNSVLQLNMGEGKSSVIIPMVAASLADGNTLVRVVVLKSLSLEMFQLLVRRLCGLPNRRICYFPFSRQTDLTDGRLQQLTQLYKDCVADGGILVVQPEHILSGKLLLVDTLLSPAQGTKAERQLHSQNLTQSLSLQRWLADKSRDVLDESDELLHVRYQLIYTKGKQQPIEGQVYRWRTIQTLLTCVSRLALSHAGDAMAVQQRAPWEFPFLQFSLAESNRALSKMIEEIAEDVVQGDLILGMSTAGLDEDEQSLLTRFLTSTSSLKRDAIRELFEDETTWNIVLILRGMLGHGLLAYALREKRWRVDYGLDASRSLLAVPYRAKDVPSAKAEFGHPDVAILLTCIAYYHQGLTSEQVAMCIRRLLKKRNPASIYSEWIKQVPEVPERIRTIRGLNIDDNEQHTTVVVPLFSRNQAVIDFYLADVVFPSAAKEYPHKLSTSGWDLAEEKKHRTTGFSGTNDNRHLLPISISQVDPVNQGGTNALVLMHLLRPENARYICTQSHSGGRMSGKEIVHQIVRESDPHIQVLLDVGAQMLDIQNLELVQCWLEADRRGVIEAAIFFNSADEMTVLSRDGSTEPFISSPMRETLWKCLVYLDDAHTRGTDLKLPRNSRAAVTLGPKVTKDRLVQGCMRMRQLGQGQSVMFLAPPAVDVAIKAARTSDVNSHAVKVIDILRWTMQETCSDLLHHAPHWAQQGLEYKTRHMAMQAMPHEPSTPDISALKVAWLQPEAKSIAEMYDVDKLHPELSSNHAFQFADLTDRLNLLGIQRVAGINLDEEQEREVSHEREVEQELQRPPPRKPHKPSVHKDVKQLVSHGTLQVGSGILSAFETLKAVRYWPGSLASSSPADTQLLVTLDFSKTLDGGSDVQSLKPVNFVLSIRRTAVLVILSQYEVNELLPTIRTSPHVRLHLYSPRTSKSSPRFDDLAFYCIPPLASSSQRASNMVSQLNIFAGQLYPSTYYEYCALCDYLGLDSSKHPRSRRRDRFVTPANR